MTKKERPTSMKERLGPEKYELWYRRHRLIENQRVWRKEMEANPLNLLPDYERAAPTDTYSLEQAFFHPIGCECGSCIDTLGRLIKIAHLDYFKDQPWVRGVTSPLPELPDQILDHLRSVEKQVLSNQDRQP